MLLYSYENNNQWKRKGYKMKRIIAILSSMAFAVVCLVGFSSKTLEVAQATSASAEIENTKNSDSVEIVFGGGTLYVQEWQNDNFGIEIVWGDNTAGFNYNYYLKDKTLHLESSQKDGNLSQKGNNKVYVYIPTGKQLNSFDISVVSGSSQIDKILSDNLILNVVGNLKVSDISVKDVDITLVQGSADVRGKISGNANILCTSGTINMQLIGNSDGYNYSVDTTFGNINLNGKNYGVMTSKKIANGSTNTVLLECVSGKIIFSTMK